MSEFNPPVRKRVAKRSGPPFVLVLAVVLALVGGAFFIASKSGVFG